MTRPDDELDNLLRNHFAAGLDPLRGQAGRAFARDVTRPMRRRLRINAWKGAVASASARLRPVASVGLTMAACMALGYFVPHWWTSPSASPSVAESQPQWGEKSFAPAQRTMTVDHEERDAGPADANTAGVNTAGVNTAGVNTAGRPWPSQFETFRFVDPKTHARTDYYIFPGEDQVVLPAGRQ